MVSSKDVTRIIAIKKHINCINDVLNEINKNYELFISRDLYKNAINQSILQIGENVNYLNEEFKKNYKEIPWGSIIKTRNIVVHHYDKIDYEIIWNTCLNDIPNLDNFVSEIIKENNINCNYVVYDNV